VIAVGHLAAAATAAGLHPAWADELARAVATACIDGVESVLDAAREALSWRLAHPGAGRPATQHHQLAGVDVEAIAQAMAAAAIEEAA